MTDPAGLRVVRGEPTDEEIAALVVALRLREPAPAPAAARASGWTERAACTQRLPARRGPGVWSRSLR